MNQKHRSGKIGADSSNRCSPGGHEAARGRRPAYELKLDGYRVPGMKAAGKNPIAVTQRQ
jgi:hypothetical protein